MSFDYSYIDIGFYNGTVITVNKNDDIKEAVGIKENKIVFVGKNEELKKLADDKTVLIDLKGRALLPGLIDSHYHPILSGFFGDEPDSSIINIKDDTCKNIEDIKDKIVQAVKIKRPGQWISMMGYDPQNLEEDRHPTVEDLDSVSPDNPVQCMHIGGHVCVYNTLALQELGVYKPEDAKKFPKNEVEVKNGKLTGMVRDHTHFALWAKVDYSPEEQGVAAMKSHQHLLGNGVTSI